MKELERLVRKIKVSKDKASRTKALNELVDFMKEENDLLKLQLAAREKELEECRKEVEELHASISYRVGRRVAETRFGGWLKKFLRKHVWK